MERTLAIPPLEVSLQVIGSHMTATVNTEYFLIEILLVKKKMEEMGTIHVIRKAAFMSVIPIKCYVDGEVIGEAMMPGMKVNKEVSVGEHVVNFGSIEGDLYPRTLKIDVVAGEHYFVKSVGQKLQPTSMTQKEAQKDFGDVANQMVEEAPLSSAAQPPTEGSVSLKLKSVKSGKYGQILEDVQQIFVFKVKKADNTGAGDSFALAIDLFGD